MATQDEAERQEPPGPTRMMPSTGVIVAITYAPAWLSLASRKVDGEALLLLQRAEGSRQERIDSFTSQLLSRVRREIARCGVPLEYFRVACLCRKEALEYAICVRDVGKSLGESFLRHTTLLHILSEKELAQKTGDGFSPDPALDTQFIDAYWKAGLWADEWARFQETLHQANADQREDIPLETLLVDGYTPKEAGFIDAAEVLSALEKPEEYEIQSPLLRKHVQSMGLRPRQVLESLEPTFVSSLGWGVQELEALVGAFPSGGHGIVQTPRSALLDGLSRAGVDRGRLDALLRHATFKARGAEKEELTPKSLDARRYAAILEDGDHLYVAIHALRNAAEAFKQSVVSGHSLEDLYGARLDGAGRAAVSRAINRLATFLSYVVADWLMIARKPLPMESQGVPRVEFDTLVGKDGAVLQVPGDQDVLYFDSDVGEVVLVEVKYFKPSQSYGDGLERGRQRVEDEKLIEKLRERHQRFEKNLDIVFDNLGTRRPERCSVRTILLLARPLPGSPTGGFQVTYMHEFAARLKAPRSVS